MKILHPVGKPIRDKPRHRRLATEGIFHRCAQPLLTPELPEAADLFGMVNLGTHLG